MTTLLAIAAIVLAFAALFVGVHAALVAPRQLTVSEHEVSIPDLGASFDGYTIVALADIHQPPLAWTGQLRRAIGVAEEAAPDLVVLLGDFAASFPRLRAPSHRFYEIGMAVSGPLLREIRAPDGVLAILGNHDYYHDGPAVARWLRGLGIRVLVNEAVVLERGDDRIVVGGTDDHTEGRADPDGGCAGQPEAPTIVLAHNPDSVLAFGTRRRMDLVLSGHTHGGQIIVPFYGAPMTLTRICTRRHPAGWVPNPRVPLLVSRGVGGDIPLRFNCPPEVLIVHLRRGDAPPRLVRQWTPERERGWRRLADRLPGRRREPRGAAGSSGTAPRPAAPPVPRPPVDQQPA